MPIASGVFKQVAYKVETTYGVVPSAGGAQSLRRVESSLDLTKDSYQSAEIRTDMQVGDIRHGVRRVGGSFRGEVSPKTYSDFFASLMRRDFTTVTAATALQLTIAAGSVINGVQQYTITRSAGDWMTSFKIGDVVRITAGVFNANNLNKNLWILGMTATVLTVVVLNATGMTAEGPVGSATVSLPGKKTWVPTNNHTDKSFSIEHFYADLVQSEVFTGCKWTNARINLPPTGLATIDWTIAGQGVSVASAQYFTAPTAANTFGVMAAVNGMLAVAGSNMVVATGLELTIDGTYSGEPVVGSNVVANQFPGRVRVTGSMTKYFDAVTQRDAFLNETEMSVMAVFTSDNSNTADFVSFIMPRVKVEGAAKNDGETGLTETIPFTALLNGAGGAGTATERTTISMQDSQA
jgi:hypothetical protein